MTRSPEPSRSRLKWRIPVDRDACRGSHGAQLGTRVFHARSSAESQFGDPTPCPRGSQAYKSLTQSLTQNHTQSRAAFLSKENPRIPGLFQVARAGYGPISDSRIAVELMLPGTQGNVGYQRCQGIEEDTPRDYISLVELKWLRDIICTAHRAPSETRRSSIEERRQRVSFSFIHEMSASPSAGMRPLPVRQSTAACDGAT